MVQIMRGSLRIRRCMVYVYVVCIALAVALGWHGYRIYKVNSIRNGGTFLFFTGTCTVASELDEILRRSGAVEVFAEGGKLDLFGERKVPDYGRD